MKNSKPFEILLDSYDNECFNLYIVISSLFDYPLIGEDEDLEGKLYASAFAYLCSSYIKSLIDFYEYDDFNLFIEEMNLLQEKRTLIKLNEQSHSIDWVSEDFSEVVWAVIQDYQLKIAEDINSVFHSHELKLRLFSSIFNMDEDGFHPILSLDTIEFFDSKFKNT